jgi:uncharacterized membrane protein
MSEGNPAPGLQPNPAPGDPTAPQGHPNIPQFVFQRLDFRQSVHTSPFPPAETLAEYEKVRPGLADEVIKQITTEADHRRKLESDEAKHRRTLEQKEQEDKGKDMVAGRAAERRGQWLAFFVVLAFLVVGAILAVCGQTIAGSIIGSGGPILWIVQAFLGRTIGLSTLMTKKPPTEKAITSVPPLPPAPH